MSETQSRAKALLGEILLRKGLIRESQLEFIIELQGSYQKNGKSLHLGDLLIAHRIIDDLTLTEALFFQESSPQESIQNFIDAIQQFQPEKA